ncbi:hypothetical protein [Blastococcus sp. CT_GayMR16]|uniref:hypothetical protein n=1 Tax=Blastococcus sp. CT_GayMR16 TaxID=2559607 RepID=UPI00107326E0|nr:hypothetical protein [Blastococcus sp. CT_GayMR16]TFV86288.1 hypothetical protein E4P38_17445 [Blastococcus sp. CT_GayMR16]
MTTSTAAANAARTSAPADGLLRLALRLDAAVTGLNGAAYLLAAPLLDNPLGLSAGLLRGTGVVLLVFAGAVWLVGSRRPVGTAAVRTVIVLNVLWAVGSVVLALTDAGTPTAVGAVWIVLQAVVVTAFAGLQVAGLRRRS